MLNKWLQTACAAKSVNFIDNFNIFPERRALFIKDGFTSNIFYSVNQTLAASATNRTQERTKQLIERRSEGQLQPAEIKINQGDKKRTEKETSSSLQQMKSPQQDKWTPIMVQLMTSLFVVRMFHKYICDMFRTQVIKLPAVIICRKPLRPQCENAVISVIISSRKTKANTIRNNRPTLNLKFIPCHPPQKYYQPL
ncbi:hypothetical protein AMECASPLE_037176 [Ameca splendens]|uniref:Uncharacterized protein n=1 Tax=Ameca splendens TaxID=208324 RepID=A0ABV0XX61_9TELE